MTNKKSTKRALLTSAIAVIMCVAMLIGTTFAWFTDTASTSVNTIQAGTLGIIFEQQKEDGSWIKAEGETLDFIKAVENEEILWEPGCTYRLPKLRIRNNENLAVIFKVAITGIGGDSELNDVITWTMDDFVKLGDEVKLLAGATKEFTIEGTMSTSAGNAYQGKSIENIAITVSARQAMQESDSNGDTYDKDSEYEPIQTPDTPSYIVSTASQLQAVLTSKNETAYGIEIEINDDIELKAGETWVPLNMNSYTGISQLVINGNGHTIKGLNDALIGYCSFGNVKLTIKDLTLTDCKVEKSSSLPNNNSLGIGAFVYAADSTSPIVFENCHLKNSTVSLDGDYASGVGGLIGYSSSNLEIKNCSVENTTVTATDSSAGAITGHVSAGTANTNITDAKVVNCTVKGEKAAKTGYVIGTANTGTTVITTKDCTGNTVFDVQNSDTIYGRFVPVNTGKLTVNGQQITQ